MNDSLNACLVTRAGQTPANHAPWHISPTLAGTDSCSIDISFLGHYNGGREQDAICEGEAQRSKSILLPRGKQARGAQGETANYSLPRH